MSRTDKIPGMKPGATGRNIAVGAVYVILLFMIVSVAASPSGDAPSDSEKTPTGTETAAATPTPTATATPSPTPTPTPGAESLTAEAEATLTSQSDYITGATVDVTDDGVRFQVSTTAQTQEQMAEVLGGAAGVYAHMVEETGVPGDATIEVYAGGKLIGTAEVKEQWAQQYNSGEMSGEELAYKVFSTIEVEDQ